MIPLNVVIDATCTHKGGTKTWPAAAHDSPAEAALKAMCTLLESLKSRADVAEKRIESDVFFTDEPIQRAVRLLSIQR